MQSLSDNSYSAYHNEILDEKILHALNCNFFFVITLWTFKFYIFLYIFQATESFSADSKDGIEEEESAVDRTQTAESSISRVTVSSISNNNAMAKTPLNSETNSRGKTSNSDNKPNKKSILKTKFKTRSTAKNA
jgi:hypothetical protein